MRTFATVSWTPLVSRRLLVQLGPQLGRLAIHCKSTTTRARFTLQTPPMLEGIPPEREFLLISSSKRLVKCRPKLLGIWGHESDAGITCRQIGWQSQRRSTAPCTFKMVRQHNTGSLRRPWGRPENAPLTLTDPLGDSDAYRRLHRQGKPTYVSSLLLGIRHLRRLEILMSYSPPPLDRWTISPQAQGRRC